MALTVGDHLGAYTVTAQIGAGGMGEVYRARDTKPDRDVALKVLPDAFTSDPDRLARFEREAKVLASLNHLNIRHIYGVEEAEGTKALVLELVEGPTLADPCRPHAGAGDGRRSDLFRDHRSTDPGSAIGAIAYQRETDAPSNRGGNQKCR